MKQIRYEQPREFIRTDEYDVHKIIAAYTYNEVYVLYAAPGHRAVFKKLSDSRSRWSDKPTVKELLDNVSQNHSFEIYQFDTLKEFLEYTLKRISE